jgi:hypothetical protein
MERRKANKYPLVEDNHASENGDSSVSVTADQPIEQDQEQEDEKKRRMRELAKERQRKFRERKRMRTNESDISSSTFALSTSAELASPVAKLPEDKAVSVLAALQNNPDKNISSQATTYLLDLAKECGFDFKK